jgi:hypothetical protein
LKFSIRFLGRFGLVLKSRPVIGLGLHFLIRRWFRFGRGRRDDEVGERCAGIENFEEIAFKEFFVGGEAGFVLEVLETLQQQLADVGHGDRVLALDATGSEHDQDFAKGGVDGGAGLEILNAVEEVGGDIFVSRGAVQLLEKMLMAEGVVARVDDGSTAAVIRSGKGAARLRHGAFLCLEI